MTIATRGADVRNRRSFDPTEPATVFHPTAGFIPNIARGRDPGSLQASERESLRALAKEVAEVAADPFQERKRSLWYRHNSLEPTRPLQLVFPEDSWPELLGDDQLTMSDPFWRQLEWYLKHLLYRHRTFHDDFVVEPDLYVVRRIRHGGWNLKPRYTVTDAVKGSYIWDPPLKRLEDIEMLRPRKMSVDEQATRCAFNAVGDVLSDTLPVHIFTPVPSANMIGEATELRGLVQVMMDMHDNPGWLHGLMDRIANNVLDRARYLEAGGYLTLNNLNHYTDSGGIGYTSELPAAGGNTGTVRLADLWGFGVAQELSGVSPAQHEEFVLSYQLRLLSEFGLNSYGCCEPLADRFDLVIKRVPRLRRLSVSPWCNVERAAAALLEGRFIFSWKPNPALLVGRFDTEAVRRQIRQTIETTRGCILEIILKDLFTIQGKPERLALWTRIVAEEIDRL